MPNKIITIQLHSVEYGGDNLGDDMAIDLTIGAEKFTIKCEIKHGATRTIDKPVSRFQSTANTVSKTISATVTEVDKAYSDVGSGSGNVSVNVTGEAQQSVGSMKVSVTGTAGNKGKTGQFTLNFTAKLEHVDRYVPDVFRGWLKVHIEDTGKDESIPYTVAVSYIETKGGREYFTIREGAHRGKTASVSLDKGNSRFSTKDERVEAVQLRYTKDKKDKTAAVLEVIGAGLKFNMVADAKKPIPNGHHDIEIPDFPHENSYYIQKGATRAATWFRIGLPGARYIHVGAHSAGCATCNEYDRWDLLYDKLIRARKAGGVSIGVMEVR